MICPCPCGKVVIIGEPSAMQAALMGAGVSARCSNCGKVGMYLPAPDSPRMRPGPNRHQRRAQKAQERKNAVPPGFARSGGGLIVPR